MSTDWESKDLAVHDSLRVAGIEGLQLLDPEYWKLFWEARLRAVSSAEELRYLRERYSDEGNSKMPVPSAVALRQSTATDDELAWLVSPEEQGDRHCEDCVERSTQGRLAVRGDGDARAGRSVLCGTAFLLMATIFPRVTQRTDSWELAVLLVLAVLLGKLATLSDLRLLLRGLGSLIFRQVDESLD